MLTKTFHGGIHLSERKDSTVDKKIKSILPPKEIFLSLRQNIGAPNKPVVNAGDPVKLGQLVGDSEAFISSPVHSPVSGKIKAIKDVYNPTYGKCPSIIIENDGKEEIFKPQNAPKNVKDMTPEELISVIRSSGVVGLGGAAFPTHVKLNIPEGKEINTLIINGAECEPYLTCDHRLMAEKTDEIIKGIFIIFRILGVKNIFIAIEENKMSAIFAIKKFIPGLRERCAGARVEMIVLKTKYPQGGEKQLIKSILKKEVPPGKLPLDIGVVVQNVGTCYSVYQAVHEGKPLIERCITLTGGCLNEPGNFLIRIGTLLSEAINACGGLKEKPAKIISGGPMMGVTQFSLDIPVIKGMTGVIFLSKKESELFEELPCIRCGKCVDICPVNLLPTDIMRMTKYSRWHYIEDLHASDCLECGSCAYICPSRIPLVQYIKLAKQKEMEKR